MKIYTQGSVEGLSRIGAYAELIAYTNTMAYARHLNVGLSVYGETILISLQNFLVVLAIFWYDAKIRKQEKTLFLGVFLLYATVLLADEKLTEPAWKTVSSSAILLIAMARGSQIRANYSNDSTGQLAGGTLCINYFIVTARLTSVLMESDEFMYHLIYVHGFCWMTILSLQFAYLNYWRSKKLDKRNLGHGPKKVATTPRRSRSPRRSKSPTKSTSPKR